MTLNLILAAFGGGLFGAVIGGLPVFIFTGFMVVAGLMASPGGIDIIGNVAFGPFLSPHIAFAGAAAAAAYAHRKGSLENGGDILTPLAKFNDPMLLIVGGVFGVIGLLFNHFFSAVLAIPTDTIAFTVVVCGVITRLVFGKSGLTGHSKEKSRVYFPISESLTTLIVIGFGIGLLSSYFAIEFNLILIGWGISAASLIFAQAGFPVPATHHICVIAALAAAATGNMILGGAFGALAAVTCDVFGKIFNSYCDSHIDPPAGAIFIGTTMVMLLF